MFEILKYSTYTTSLLICLARGLDQATVVLLFKKSKSKSHTTFTNTCSCTPKQAAHSTYLSVFVFINVTSSEK